MSRERRRPTMIGECLSCGNPTEDLGAEWCEPCIAEDEEDRRRVMQNAGSGEVDHG